MSNGLPEEENKSLLDRLRDKIKKNYPKSKGDDYIDYIPEEEPEMAEAEAILAQRQAIEFQDRKTIPEREEEIVAKLFELDSRMATNKHLIKVKDSKTGIERMIGIESADEYPEAFNTDLTKANLLNDEIKSCWGNITLMNLLRSIGKSSNFPLKSIAQFNNAQKNSIINLSRGRGGFSAILSRTHRGVSEGVIEHMKREAKEKKEKKWGVF